MDESHDIYHNDHKIRSHCTLIRCSVLILTGICVSLLVILVVFSLIASKTRYEEKREQLSSRKNNEAYQWGIVNTVADSTDAWQAVYNPSAASVDHVRTKQLLDEIRSSFDGKFLDYMTRNDLRDMDLESIKQYTNQMIRDLIHVERNESLIPKNFDSREKWPQCWTIADIHDQGSCGSCWAVSTVSHLSDRTCIKSGGKTAVQLSSEQAINCCALCDKLNITLNRQGKGCQGGTPDVVMYDWVHRGLVTGGKYGSAAGCQPYSYHADCGHPCPIESYQQAKSCKTTCHPSYQFSYEQDLHKGKWYLAEHLTWDRQRSKLKFLFELGGYDLMDIVRDWTRYDQRLFIERLLKLEIMNRGPIITSLNVHEDFQHYKSGVYHHVTGELVYSHFVKIIGWGEESGRDYWLMANSFGRNWGENGFAKVDRTVFPFNMFIFAFPE